MSEENKTEMSEKSYTVKQVSQITGLSQDRIRRLIGKELTAKKIDGWKISESDLQRFIQSRTREAH